MHLLASAKATGRSHIASGAVCQDAVAVLVVDQYFLMALSDGAGSAERSDEGSNAIVNSLIAYFRENKFVLRSFDLKEIHEHVNLVIAQVRSSLIAKGRLDLFHATLIFAIGNGDLVHVFHLGDGAAFVGEITHNKKILTHRSDPHNGEFSNETYFFTEDSWQSHLRSFSVNSLAFCVICSDGVDPFLWDNTKGTRLGFLKPLLNTVLASGSNSFDASESLLKIITDPRADNVTSDDKSVAVMCNKDIKSFDLYDFEDKNKPQVKDQAMLKTALDEAFLLSQKSVSNGVTFSQSQAQINLSKEKINSSKSNKSTSLAYVLLGFLLLSLVAGVSAAIYVSDNPNIVSLRQQIKFIFGYGTAIKNSETQKNENEISLPQQVITKSDVDKGAILLDPKLESKRNTQKGKVNDGKVGKSEPVINPIEKAVDKSSLDKTQVKSQSNDQSGLKIDSSEK